MQDATTFGNILEAADDLSVEDQQDLVEILHRRLVEHRRDQLADDIRAADEEFREGKCPPASPDNLISEISS